VNSETIQEINWLKVISNAIIGFCTALLGTAFSGVPIDVTQPAIITALLVGLLALGTELNKEAEECPPTLQQRIKASLLLF